MSITLVVMYICCKQNAYRICVVVIRSCVHTGLQGKRQHLNHIEVTLQCLLKQLSKDVLTHMTSYSV